VPLYSRKVAYDRTRILVAADRARAKGRRRKAIALYRRVLMVEPGDPDLHARIAPLLARSGQPFDAWNSFRTAASAYLRGRQMEQVLAVYKEATRSLPMQIETWRHVAKLQRKIGRNRQAMETLLEARRHFRGRRHRAEAIYLLRRVRDIDAWHVDTVIDLSKLLARSRQRVEAESLLTQLAERLEGRPLRRVRACHWWISPTLQNSWLWMRALFSSETSAAQAEPRAGALRA